MKEPETGKKENTGKSGYSITTWRLHLWCRHPEWLRTTQEFYNRIAEFYYNLLLDHTDLWEMGSQQTLRELEIMSIPGRGGRIPSDPLPWQKVPLYFRRAAANEGIASAKSYLSRFAQDEKIGRAEKLNAAVTYYKGMYQDFSAKEITLRVWTGDTWTWMHCRLSGRAFPENARLMSPSVVFEYKYDMLHVPVRQNNENTATVRQRMQAGCRILCIQFTKGLKPKEYYLVVGRFVPENNYETMIREFMKSKTKKDFAIITNVNDKFLAELEERLHFKSDKRIKFVGTVYNKERLMKIRENAYGYFHGHEVGGTNPSLLEALGSTDLNLLLDVGFNREVAEDSALYWSKKDGDLARLIEKADQMGAEELQKLGAKSTLRIEEAYSWSYICEKYEKVWLGENG